MTRTNFRMEDKILTMIRGDTLSFGIEIEDKEGNPLDIETAYFTCKQSVTSYMNYFQKSLGNGITRQETGKYVLRIAPEDTEAMEAGKYVYDFQLGANGDIFTIMKGVLEIEHDVTY